MLSLLFLSACAPSLTIPTANDTGSDASDADADSDTDADSDGDADTDSGDPVMVTDFSAFTGFRHFFVDQWGITCDETVDETGEQVVEGSDTYSALHHVCGDCQYFFEVESNPDNACSGYVDLPAAWRGLTIEDNNTAHVYFYHQTDSGPDEYADDGEASFDGTDVVFDYTYDLGAGFNLAIDGGMTFGMMEE